MTRKAEYVALENHRDGYPELMIYIIKRAKGYEEKAQSMFQQLQEYHRKKAEILEHVGLDMITVTTSDKLAGEKTN